MECILEFLINMAFLYRLLNFSTFLKMSNFLHDGNVGICVIPTKINIREIWIFFNFLTKKFTFHNSIM